LAVQTPPTTRDMVKTIRQKAVMTLAMVLTVEAVWLVFTCIILKSVLIK
jgi:hypothetical protein